MKTFSVSRIIREMQIKHGDFISHQSNWQKFKRMTIQCTGETTRNQTYSALLTRMQTGTTPLEENLAISHSVYGRLPGDLATDMWRQGCSFYTIYNWKRSTCLTQESGWINHDMPTSQSTMQLYKRMTRISIKQYGGISRRHYYVGGEGQVQDWGMFHLCKKKKRK